MQIKKFPHGLLAAFLTLGAVLAQPMPEKEISAGQHGSGEMLTVEKKNADQSSKTGPLVTFFMTGESP